jgi:hypothetical protein
MFWLVRACTVRESGERKGNASSYLRETYYLSPIAKGNRIVNITKHKQRKREEEEFVETLPEIRGRGGMGIRVKWVYKDFFAS